MEGSLHSQVSEKRRNTYTRSCWWRWWKSGWGGWGRDGALPSLRPYRHTAASLPYQHTAASLPYHHKWNTRTVSLSAIPSRSHTFSNTTCTAECTSECTAECTAGKCLSKRSFNFAHHLFMPMTCSTCHDINSRSAQELIEYMSFREKINRKKRHFFSSKLLNIWRQTQKPICLISLANNSKLNHF